MGQVKTEKTFYRNFFSIYIVLVLQNVVTISVNLADNVMLGGYSETALSGVAAVNQIQFVYQQLLTALGDGLVIFCSQYWGETADAADAQDLGGRHAGRASDRGPPLRGSQPLPGAGGGPFHDRDGHHPGGRVLSADRAVHLLLLRGDHHPSCHAAQRGDGKDRLRPLSHGFLCELLHQLCSDLREIRSPGNGGGRGGGNAMFVVRMDLVSIWMIVIPLSFVMAFVVKASPAVVVCCLNADQIFKCVPAFLESHYGNWIRKLTREP